MADPGDPRGGVALLVRDLFFRVKLEAALRALVVPFRVTGRDALLAEGAEPPALVILDLGDVALDPLGTLRALRARTELADVPVIGYASHVDRDLREAARQAGCTVVVSRSRMSSAPSELLAPFLTRLD